MSRSNSSVTAPPPGRWLQLCSGLLCMVAVANLQYGWTLFVHPLHEKYGWSLSSIQTAFAVFIIAETWLVPFEGWVVDRFGPKYVVAAGGVLVGAAWSLNSMADSLFLLYVAAALGGIGAGAVYGTCVGNAVRWFSDRRGLAVGFTVAGFGAGSALSIIPIQDMIATRGYQAAFLWFGLVQGLIVFVTAWALRAPPRGEAVAPAPRFLQTPRDFAPTEMLKSRIFWLLYFMFILVYSGGLMATAQIAPIARDFKVADVPVSLLGLTLPALTFAITLDRVMNGVTRPLCGWISDHIGRENTLFIAFLLEGIGIWALWVYGQDPLLFVILGGLAFFAWGETASLFPTICTDVFGTKYATTNAALLYTAKGVASLLIPLASFWVVETGSWHDVFMTAALFNLLAAFLALAVLKPLRLPARAPAGEA
ncbi:oxalate/formate MFS antiporter [Reyranella sp.]|uniref:oxalate/formate MFS antiporter n=1 Tax=Reyranella sp. TaxID=1929291 RepID=UPI000BD9185A|nr:oxalate/formate MFS antiporter [Reyranella sp.]OYY46991.1 MAG: oxalate/formate MFS antiporter [Rhodospirillales bacterium 35-66-84]OYZ97011.1 MAG: oxalate/formate MFS antiporter [Rhodospirillales bacterium 24-66-33]OZB27661.1 MAG: oxalate/formate MFS antiporter [Rhodospirillales bacterium 39-66-50]HQS13923.1 oxalate/formate MFS antiporter [Reyranella sp.]HQT10408.1 oxalate/formate MFS antiporter [Reyranella sp.]